MASFRILNQAPQYLLADGTVNAGGKLQFYETDLTTPKNTWSDEALTVLNSNPVVMDAAGRTLTDVWGDGEYGVKMLDADDVVIWTRNNVKASNADGVTIPALEDGEFLTNNGSVLQWQPIIQVPDPTGHADDILYSDGTLAYWGPPPAEPEPVDPEVEVTANSFRVGVSTDNTKALEQWGRATAPASGLPQTTLSVVFTTAYDAIPVTMIIPTSSSQPGGPVVWNLTAESTTGFTVVFDVAEGSPSSSNIVNPVPFAWRSIGTKEIA